MSIKCLLFCAFSTSKNLQILSVLSLYFSKTISDSWVSQKETKAGLKFILLGIPDRVILPTFSLKKNEKSISKHILKKKSEHYHTFACVGSHGCHRKTNNYLVPSTCNSKPGEYIGAITKRATKPRALCLNPLFNRSRMCSLQRKQHDICKVWALRPH